MRDELLNQALRETQERQEENQRRSMERRRKAEARSTVLKELLAERESLVRNSIQGILNGSSGKAENLPEIRRRNWIWAMSAVSRSFHRGGRSSNVLSGTALRYLVQRSCS